jgi:signal transduction histidine kinase
MNINNLINSGYDFNNNEKLIQRKFNYLNIVLFIGLFGLLLGLFYNLFILEKYKLAYIEMGVLAFQLLNIYILRLDKKYRKYIVFMSSFLIVFVFNILYSLSSPGELKIIWIFIYAPALMVINKKEHSIIWLSILIFTILAQSFQTIYPIEFTHSQTIYFLVVTIILSLLMYYIDSIIKDDIDTIIYTNNQLNELNDTLEDRVMHEIKQNRIKDNRLAQQSKSANIGSMVANISHQWKQPLSIISASIGNLSLYKEGLLDDSEFDTMKNNIEDNVKYLTQTIDDFRNLLNPNQSKSLNSISSIVKSTTNLLSTEIIKHNIIMRYDYQYDEEIEIYKNDLIQVFLVLLNNSIYQMSQHENQDRFITISTNLDDNHIRLSITDSGGGIDDDVIKNIFDRYFTTKDNDNGTGLGLNIARDLVEHRLDGNIYAKNIHFEVEGKSHKGACFEILLKV